jgi:uncharacterized protein (DUF1697 family)
MDMSTWILLLRGINVGGKHSLPMKALKDDLKGLGLQHVKTYIQSGNVVFQSSGSVPSGLGATISDVLEAHHGFRPHVLLLSADALEKAAAANPFPEAEAEPKSLHLFFLDTAPTAPDLDALTALRLPSEHFHLEGKVFYLHAPDGIGRSKLAARVEKALGVTTTARNWRTVQKLQELAGSS